MDGRRVVHRDNVAHLIDVVLVADVRGLGTRRVRSMMDGPEGLPVTIHVEQINPAVRLNERLGF